MGNEKNLEAHILIVDDEPSIRHLLHSILCDDYTCTLAESAETALSRLENETFDVIISDINMGGMSGIELISHVVKSSPDTVVMMISGNQTIDSPIEAIRRGAFDYVKKPFDADQVEISVARAVSHAALLASKRKHENHLEQLVEERTAKLNYLAYHDAVTDLPNRAFLEDRLIRTLSQRPGDGNVAVLFISLDRFHGLRDTLGHSFGDQLLKRVGQRLTAVANKSAIVARFEGDIFALLLADKRADELVGFADSVFSAFTSPLIVGEHEIFLSVSIGISHCMPDGVACAKTRREQSPISYIGH